MSTGITIAFFGSSLVSAYWNGAATYYRGILKTLFQHGHDITFYEPDAFDRQANRDIPDPEYARVVVYQPAGNELPRIVEEASRADIVIKASGVGINDRFLEEALIGQKRPGQQVIFWDVDAPATLEGTMSEKDHYFKDLIPLFDQILTYGGGDPVENTYLKLGAQSCTSIYNGFDPEVHFPSKSDKKYQADLGFLGNRLPDRESRVKEFFLEVARLLPEKKFVLGGAGWDEHQLSENIHYVGHVPTAQHNAFNATPKAVLNLSRESMAKYGYSPATRVFEAAAAGACIITDFWEGIDCFFEPNKEILVVHTQGELMDLLMNLSAHQARAIGQAARERALLQHTYGHRAAHLEKIFNHQTMKP